MMALVKTAETHGKSTHTAKKLRTWSHSFINDPENLLFNLYGSWNASMLESSDLVKAIHEHLMRIGEYVSAVAVVWFVNSVEIKNWYSLKRNMLLAIAQQWMHTVGYRWRKSPMGQYVDGHEHSDVVTYRQTSFLPRMAQFEEMSLSGKHPPCISSGLYLKVSKSVKSIYKCLIS